jgi:HEPN domain-containing protein
MGEKRKIAEGWFEKAGNQLQTAREHSKSYSRYSESVQASQECVELSVKSILFLLGVEYSASHGWDKDQFSKIAKQIQEKHLVERLKAQDLNYAIRLPRLLLLVNFWNQFYLPAKYGFEAGYLAPPQDLFDKEEADIALHHADECWRAASHLRYLPDDKLNAIVGASEP